MTAEHGSDSPYWKFFDMYCFWLSLPKQYVDYADDKLQRLGFDEDTIELLRIRTKKAFAEKYQIGYASLLAWDKDPKAENAVREHWRRWAKKKTPNVIGKLYEKIMEEGDAARIKTWQSFVEQQADKLDIDAGLSKVYENMQKDGDIKPEVK